jgi:limonene 1,2-monooxygenase
MFGNRELGLGIFVSPVHSPHLDPTWALNHDIQLIETADRLGFDEAWVGEHRSTGWEYIGSPEVFIANLISRTSRIRLGTGVISLPYHHPLNVAERIILLDHLSAGRVMMGTGPGAFPTDTRAMGIEPAQARRMMEESLECVLALRAGEQVTRETDWFVLRDAYVQLGSFTKPHLEVAVATIRSPNGPRLAGRLGTSLLSFNATAGADFEALSAQWAIVEEEAGLHERTVSRTNWRLAGPMFVAETRKEARRAVARGLSYWAGHFRESGTIPWISEMDDLDQTINHLVDSGFAVIGSPDDAIQQLRRLEDQTGGFGTFLVWANDWASPNDTRRSLELIASEVRPAITRSTERLHVAEGWARQLRPELMEKSAAASQRAIDDYERERKARQNQVVGGPGD